MDKNTIIRICNRDNAAVFYDIPEMNGLHRVFQPNEIKEVTLEELIKLSYEPGGMSLLKNNFILNNKEAINMILGQVEPEYSYTPADVKNLLLNGSLDELLDCLDFAPEGVIELVKTLAVELPLNDVAKREAILEKTNFNVTNAIQIKKDTEADVPQPAAAPTKRRVTKKVESSSTEETKGRRVIK
jgi:hypothetical protein